jgi:hypothetical protein
VVRKKEAESEHGDKILPPGAAAESKDDNDNQKKPVAKSKEHIRSWKSLVYEVRQAMKKGKYTKAIDYFYRSMEK